MFLETATDAVCDVFEGQPYHDPNMYTVDPGIDNFPRMNVQAQDSLPGFEIPSQQTFDFKDEPDVGYKNAAIELLVDTLDSNLHAIQDRQNLEHTSFGGKIPELEVEMETGTGKTFVYIKTIFELNKRYGWSKFIIIVPGIAIREGVKKSLDIMADKFIAEVIRIINEQKATMIVEHIQYHILEDTYSSDIFTKNQMILPAHMIPIRDDGKPLQKHIYDFLTTDSSGEKTFAKELDNSEEVVVYAKLPGGFAIPTPLGNYNPDWASAFKKGSVKHLSFVAETKGSLSELQLREIEKAKIACAKKFFVSLGIKNTQYHVTYRQVVNYQDLLNMAHSASGD